MKYPYLFLSSVILVSAIEAQAQGDQLRPSYPSVPSSYENLNPGKLVAAAQVDFKPYYVDWTDGYRVQAPNGDEFIVDDIEQPKCAFYATYVDTDDGMGMPSGTEVVSNVYIGEVNFENCQ